jgi:hypothetical protein
MKQLLEGLCLDVQAAVHNAAPTQPLSAFTNVKDHELQSLPPSQDYQMPSDTALLRGTFPQLVHNFSEAEAVQLMLLGLRDRDAVDCMTHGVQRNSAASAAELNPVDQVFRMAADMSGCFSSLRSLSSAPHPAAQVHPLSTVAPPSTGGPALSPDADDLVTQLRAIRISDDAAVLTDMSANLRRGGIFAIEELQGLSMDELKDAVFSLNLNAVQLRRLFAAVSKP